MPDRKVLLKAENISKNFLGVKALVNVEIEVMSGEVHALLGENGAGKSTLIKVITGAENKDSGKIYFIDKEISPKNTREAQKIGISTVYQEVNLCPNLSVAENICIGRGFGKTAIVNWKMMNEHAKELLKRFDLDIDVTKKLDSYSLAIQQMVAVARAIDISAKILILDEPTSSLSAVEVEKLFDVIRMLKSNGMGIIFVTHFLDQVYAISDSITILRNGEYVGTYKTVDLPKVELVGKMIGKEFSELESMLVHEDRKTKNESDVLLSLKQATGLGVPNPIDLDVHKGEVLGLSGLLGSGRSEIVRLIFAVTPITSGEIKIKGKKNRFRKTIDAIRSGFGFCPEDRKLEGIVGDLSVRENIILSLQAKRGMFKSISRFDSEKIADEYIKKLSIKTSSSDQLVKNLSGGNQQKVVLARWLATEPDLFILDEPTRGIDIGAKIEIQKIVIDLAYRGVAVIFISSEIDEMLNCSQRMIVLRDKKIVKELTGVNMSENLIIKYVAGGG